MNRSSLGSLLNCRRFLNVGMAVHRLESSSEHWTLLDLIPVVQHQSVFNRAADFFLSTWDHLLLVLADCCSKRRLTLTETY